MGVWRGQPCPKSEPPLLKRDGWGGGATLSDLHLLIELSPESCHTSATEHHLENPSFMIPPRDTKLLWPGSWGWWEVKSGGLHCNLIALEIMWGLKMHHSTHTLFWSVEFLSAACIQEAYTSVFIDFIFFRFYILFYLCIFLVNNGLFLLFTLWL